MCFFSGRRWRVTPRPFSFYMQRIVFFLSFFFSFYRHIFVLWDPLFSTKKKNTIAAPIVRTTGRTQGGWMHARFNSSFFWHFIFSSSFSLGLLFWYLFHPPYRPVISYRFVFEKRNDAENISRSARVPTQLERRLACDADVQISPLCHFICSLFFFIIIIIYLWSYHSLIVVIQCKYHKTGLSSFWV